MADELKAVESALDRIEKVIGKELESKPLITPEDGKPEDPRIGGARSALHAVKGMFEALRESLKG